MDWKTVKKQQSRRTLDLSQICWIVTPYNRFSFPWVIIKWSWAPPHGASIRLSPHIFVESADTLSTGTNKNVWWIRVLGHMAEPKDNQIFPLEYINQNSIIDDRNEVKTPPPNCAPALLKLHKRKISVCASSKVPVIGIRWWLMSSKKDLKRKKCEELLSWRGKKVRTPKVVVALKSSTPPQKKNHLA